MVLLVKQISRGCLILWGGCRGLLVLLLLLMLLELHPLICCGSHVCPGRVETDWLAVVTEGQLWLKREASRFSSRGCCGCDGGHCWGQEGC